MKRLSHLISGLEEAVIAILLVGMTLLVFVEVILRFFFNTGLSWVQEATLLTAAWFVLFGASYGVKVGAHIGVDALVRILPRGVRRIVAFIAVILCLIYCGMFIYGAWVYLAKVFSIGIKLHDIPIPRWVAHSALLIGFVMLAIRFLQLLWMIATNKADGFSLADEAKDAMRLSEPGHHEAEGEAGR